MRYLATLVTIVLLGAALAAPRATSAQAGDNPFADLGLSEIAVTITDDTYEGAPSELEAGRYVLAVTNEVEPEEDAFSDTLGAAFLQVPEGMTAADLMAMLSPAAATPEAAPDEASPAAEEDGGDQELPPFYYETGLAGGLYAFPGETAYAVVDLTAGEWILWGESPDASQAPVPVTVTGEPPADPPAPAADVTIEMSDHAFAFDPPLAAGPQVIELANVGEQPHFFLLLGVPEGTTVEDFLALSATFGDPAATPPAGLSFEDITEGFNTGDQSAGVTAWYAADIEAGTYVAACFITDPESGAPHAFLGMTQIVVVE